MSCATFIDIEILAKIDGIANTCRNRDFACFMIIGDLLIL